MLPGWALSSEFVSIRQGVTFCENSVSRPLVSKLLKILGRWPSVLFVTFGVAIPIWPSYRLKSQQVALKQ